MAGRFLADIIGEEYKQWKAGECVLATTTTGSGKTWFVLNRLLPYAKEQGKHVVYYCNRKFLNMQVQASAKKRIYDDMGQDKEGLAPYLHIRTYQYTERKRDFPNVVETDENGNEYAIPESQILYYVFDEAMYPVQDSGFSSTTKFWYEKRRELKRKYSVTVFLTATPEAFYLYRKTAEGGLEALFQQFVAKHAISKDDCYSRWSYYLNKPYVKRSDLMAELGDPYKDLFEWVEDAYGRGSQWVDHNYAEERSLFECYDYVDTHYFDKMDSLARLIAESVKKSQQKAEEKKTADEELLVEDAWLVFVRTRNDAESLQIALEALDCKSIQITSAFTKQYDETPAKRKNSRKQTFHRLINEEYLDVHVLISTSVLDCGVTLHAKNVSHLVVCQPNKTSFRQMLGRIRVQEKERINLYIQSHTPKQIDAFARNSRNDFLFAVQFMWINEWMPKCWFMPWKEPDTLYWENDENCTHFLPDATRQQLIRDLEENEDKWRFLLEKEKPKRRRYDLQSVNNLDINELSVIYALSQVYAYEVQLPVYENDPYYFLKEQLSWIGKEYDPTCWIDYQSSREPLYKFLTEKSITFDKKNSEDWKKTMSKTEQSRFREKCFECLSIVREPPESFLQVKKRHVTGSNKYPGKSKLNEVFADMGIPYHIYSPQKKSYLTDTTTGQRIIDSKTGKPKVDNKSYWYVGLTDVETERLEIEEKREAKQIRKEERKAEKERQAQTKNEKPAKKELVIAIARGDSMVFPNGKPPEISEVQQEPINPEKSKKKKLVVAIKRGKKITLIEENSDK